MPPAKDPYVESQAPGHTRDLIPVNKHENTQHTQDGMRYNTLAFAGLAALAAATDVHDLTTESFEPFVNDHGLVLAECT